MGWLTAIANLLPLGIDFAAGWQERRLETRKVKHDAEMQWLASAANERNKSWKDEYILVISSYPIISAFIPFWGIRENTIESLTMLSQLPDWMIWAWLTIVAAVYGAMKLLDKVKIR